VVTAIVSVAVAGLMHLDHQGAFTDSGTSDWGRYDQKTFKVSRVVDGDTVDVDQADGQRTTTRIRLWGIDTPEVARPQWGKVGEPYAEEAKQCTQRLCFGQEVRLLLDPHQSRDRYGRLLATIQLPDGTLLNERLLLAGLAEYEERFSHQWMSRFENAEDAARSEKVGLWSGKK
jgi:micrococcal nuclease